MYAQMKKHRTRHVVNSSNSTFCDTRLMVSTDTTLPNNLKVIRKGLLEFIGLEDTVVSMTLLDPMSTGKSFSLNRTLGIDGFHSV